MNKPLVSVIVVTYNAEKLLPAFFSNLARTTYSPYEVLVVDNASADGTVSYLSSEQPRAKVIANEIGGGYGSACHQGAELTQGDLMVFMNPDVFVTPDWLNHLVNVITANPDAAIVSPQTLPPGEPPRISASAVEEVAAAPGCAMMVRRQAWEDLGGFDRTFFLYWEDTELCWRAWLAGWRVLLSLDAHVCHDEGSGGGGQRWTEEQIKNGLYTYLKLLPWHRALPLIVLLAGKTVMRILLLRRPTLVRAWIWNVKHVRLTLERRRAFARGQHGDAWKFERLLFAHTVRQRRERLAALVRRTEYHLLNR